MAQADILKYKGKPFIRKGDEIYYGNMADDFVILLKILSKKTVKDEEIADKVLIQLLSTDEKIPAAKRIVKSSEKNGLYNAMDIGAVWLDRALHGKI